jgi:outer membrane protein TolC
MRETSSRGFGVVALVILALCFTGPAAGQSLALPPNGAVDLAQGASGPVRQLSINDAIQLALQQNLGLQVQRLEPQIADESIVQVKTSWVPYLTSNVSNNSSSQPVGSFLSGAVGKLTYDTFTANVGANQQLPWYGGNYSVAWNNSRQKSNSSFDSPNPAVLSNITVNFTQPLMRNFKTDTVRQQLELAKLTRETSDITLRQAIILTQRNVRYAYWNLAFSIASLAVQRQSLDLAREQLKNNRARVEVGTMAPIDIIEAEAEVANREQGVIVAESQVEQSEDNLRTLIFDPSAPDFWKIKLELSDKPEFQTPTIDVDGAIKTALERRTDLLQAKNSLRMSDVNIAYTKNQLLPDVNVSASYRVAGQGGTEIEFSNSFPPVQTGSGTVGFGQILSQMFQNEFPTWSVGVAFSYPLGTSTAEASLARARLQYTQSQLELRNAELQVTAQVRDVGRQVNTNTKRVVATRAAAQLAAKRLEAEQKKFAAGMSTSFLIFQAQRDLAQAQSDELSSILDFNKSLVDFEAVQEAPVTGSVGSVSVAGGSTSAAGNSLGGAGGITGTAASSRSRGGQ